MDSGQREIRAENDPTDDAAIAANFSQVVKFGAGTGQESKRSQPAPANNVLLQQHRMPLEAP